MQYNACLVITGAFKGTSRERLYQELGLESLKDRRWHRKMCFFNKIVKGLLPKYLTSYLQLHNNPIYQTRSTAKNIVKLTASRTVNFNNSFFPLCSQEWNNLSDDIKSLPSPISFKKALLSFVKTSENSVFAIHDNNGIKLLTRLRLNFSHLNEHKFRHNFLDTLNPMCSCGSEPETTAHFLLRCQNHVTNRSKFIKNVYNLDQTLRNYDGTHLLHILLYGSEKLNFNLNKEIINLAICYLKDTECFNENLILSINYFYLLLLLSSLLFNCIETLIFNIYLP